jgi:FkbH-like protein
MNRSVPESSETKTTIAVAATFTAEPVEPVLRFWMQELQIPADIAFAPYNQAFQQLVDPSSLLSGNRNGINVLMLRLGDLFPRERLESEAGTSRGRGPAAGRPADEAATPALADDSGRADRDVTGFLAALKSAVGRGPTPYLVLLCPPSAAAQSRDSRMERMEMRLTAGLRAIPGVDVITSEELMRAYPVEEIFDPDGDRLASVPYTEPFFVALGTMIARRFHAARRNPYKVVAFDADQTLWTGVCGEDGANGVEIGPARRAIQEFLERQRESGMILCLCSKNNDGDVAAVFDGRPEMVLRRNHIVGWRVNWRPKSENLRSLARELRLRLESFLFLDDDPVACAEVQTNCPEVLTLLLPQDPEAIAPFLEKIWAFDQLAPTKEAASRTAFYREESQRREFQMESPTLKDFLAGLGLKVQIAPLAAPQLGRASELTRRTNQFNVTAIRRTEAGLQSLLGPGGPECFAVRVKDRFGDYGLVGAMIFSADPAALLVDTFLLSCRALGRGVEHRMLARLGEIAMQRGLSRVDIPFVPTGKNQPAFDFLESIGSDWKISWNDGFLFRFPAVRAAAVRYDPPPAGPTEDLVEDRTAPAPAPGAVDARAEAALLTSIATELADVGQITAWMTPRRRTRPDSGVPFVAPSTDQEVRVTRMFAEVLGLEEVGIHDSFFRLGGHSLLALRLINRLRDAFRVEVPIAVLFEEDFTVAKAVQAIETYETAPPESTTESLKRLLESMSDDEVRILLAEQRRSVPGAGGGEKA